MCVYRMKRRSADISRAVIPRDGAKNRLLYCVWNLPSNIEAVATAATRNQQQEAAQTR